MLETDASAKGEAISLQRQPCVSFGKSETLPDYTDYYNWFCRFVTDSWPWVTIKSIKVRV